jgi:hypothetical protein
VNAHLRRKKVDARHQTLKWELVVWRNKVKGLIQDQCAVENTLMRARYLFDTAEKDMLQILRSNDRFDSNFWVLERTIHKRNFQSVVLKEKCRILRSQITAEAATYVLKAKRVDGLLAQLNHEVSILQTLQKRVNHADALKLERIRLDKSLLEARGRVKALEEELETPMHIHRWRFLESTNPEAMQMLKMAQILRAKLMVKVATRERIHANANALQAKLSLLSRRVRDITIAEHEESVHFFEQMLKQKIQQFNDLIEQVAQQKEVVLTSKRNVEAARSELRNSKGDFYLRKKQSDELKAHTWDSRVGGEQPLLLSGQRFIGGGFAVSASADLTVIKHPRPRATTSQIVIPKVTPTATLLPKAWNPARPPLNTMLPTVSELQQL